MSPVAWIRRHPVQAGVFRLALQICVVSTTVIGVAGIPSDVRTWAMWLEPISAVLEDSWLARACLVLCGFALVTYPQWTPKVRAYISRLKRSKGRPRDPQVNWREAEDRFSAIDGELEATWNEYDDGPMEWYIVPVGSDPDGRRMERFLIEARRLGRMLEGCDVTRRFPNAAAGDDPANEWMNVVAARVAPSSTAGDGHSLRRHYVCGSIEKVVDASELTCRHFASGQE